MEPHQIQGLDYERISPVIKWLVDKVILHRQKYGDEYQKYAQWLYDYENQSVMSRTEVTLSPVTEMERLTLTDTGSMDNLEKQIHITESKIKEAESFCQTLESELISFQEKIDNLTSAHVKCNFMLIRIL